MFPAGQKGRAVRTSAPARPVGKHKKGEKQMKKASKFLCALLAVVLTAALAVPAFAAGTTVTLEYDYDGYPVKGTLTNVVKTVRYTEQDFDGKQSTHMIYVISDQGAKFNVSFVRKPTDDGHVYEDDDGVHYRIGFFGYGNWDAETKRCNGENGTEFWVIDGILSTSFGPYGEESPLTYIVNDGSMIYIMHESEFAKIPADMYTVLSGATQPAKPAAPGVKPAPGVSVPLNDGSGEFAYTVKSGDTLSRIAAYYYGNVNVYNLIYERNKDALKSPGMIYAGQTIILPSYAAVAQGVAKI